jgi:biopolymer transport protein ExbB/TolQ
MSEGTKMHFEPDSNTDREAWHLSKSVPLAFVVTLLLQTIVLVSWAATFKQEFVSFRAQADRQFTEIRTYIDAKTTDRYTRAQASAELAVRDAHIRNIEARDQQMFEEIRRFQDQVSSKLERIENKIDRARSNHVGAMENGR